MKLHFCGINHYDPLGRHRLKDWMQGLLDKEATAPAFVAVEWDEMALSEVIGQRGEVPRLIRDLSTTGSLLVNATPENIIAIAKSLGYEGDTHHEVFPQVEFLWLDQALGRRERQLDGTWKTNPIASFTADYAKQRIVKLQRYIDTEGATDKVLERISAGVWRDSDKSEADDPDIAFFSRIQRSNPDPEPINRDAIWSERIIQRVAEGEGDWAIIVVGANHIADCPGTLLNRLEKEGFDCEPHVLRPS